MVQIRREHARRTAAAATGGALLLLQASRRNRTVICWQTVAVSALVPVLFLLRAWFSSSSSSGGGQHHNFVRDGSGGVGKNNPYVEYLQHGLDWSNKQQLQQQLPGYLVELDYCDTTGFDFAAFVEQVEGPLLNSTLTELHKQQQKQQQQQQMQLLSSFNSMTTTKIEDDDDDDDDQTTAHEFLLQLLEQHLQMEGRCDYSQYRPTVPASAVANVQLPNSNNDCPVVAVISAFRDAEQLTALLQALLLDDDADDDDHRICAVVHLDDLCDDEYRAAVHRVVDELNHPQRERAAILQFGSVVYRTDALSLINLRILRWLTTDTHMDYQYVLLLDGSAFPLVPARALVDALLLPLLPNSRRDVWLGALTHRGQDAAGAAWDSRLQRKRLIDTRRKRHKRLPRDAWGGSAVPNAVPPHIRRHFVYKTTSGNQAAYSRRVVQQLLDSDAVMELFALAKYGCCCCIEEHSWAAALSMIGHAPDAFLQQPPMMFQAWGGDSSGDCAGSMNNAVLSTNASLCFRSEDPVSNISSNATAASAEQRMYYRGDRMWDRLVDARRRGFLLARKFWSDRADSVQLRRDVQSRLWPGGLGRTERGG